MSIIIIGVGNADFSKMMILDADKSSLQDSHCNPAARDIVQFVSMNDYSKDITFLHEDVLREVPHQLVSYMRMNKIPANKMQHTKVNEEMY
jgi:hypothetical protein